MSTKTREILELEENLKHLENQLEDINLRKTDFANDVFRIEQDILNLKEERDTSKSQVAELDLELVKCNQEKETIQNDIKEYKRKMLVPEAGGDSSTLKSRIDMNAISITAEQVGKKWLELGVAMQPIITDANYRIVPLSIWKEIIIDSDVDDGVYEAEIFDCENFAMAFSVDAAKNYHLNGAGIALSPSAGHAFTALLVRNDENPDDFRILFLEPQNDYMVTVDKPNYDLNSGFVWFG